MPRLIYTRSALRDLERLHDFLLRKDPKVGQAALGTIRKSLTRLAVRPQMGRPARGMAPEFREWSIPFGRDGYIALDHFSESETVVLAIRHSKEAGY